MGIKFSDLEAHLKEAIVSSLRPFFDQIHFENRLSWIMIIHYGPYELIESFNDLRMEMYEDYNCKERVEMFEKQKLRLFLDGVYLYLRGSGKEIALVCDAFNEHYSNIL
jgi:hypothetical protein